VDRLAAVRSERQTVLEFCRRLTPEQWQADSAAPGWRVQDVVAHMGGIAHEFFTPYMAKVISAKSIERFNDTTVERRASRTGAEVLAEYERWTGRLGKLLGAANKTPLGKVPFKLAEMGWYPMGTLASAVVFDTHTHLRHDIAPALDLPRPPTDETRMAAAMEWMFAVLAQSPHASLGWLDRPVALTLEGLGGGTWRVANEGDRLRVDQGDPNGAVARITGRSEEFPVWGTRRGPWQKHDLEITGDQDYATRFLDSVRIV
jgi:uncharacterized protein (TIGR03083 family)